MARLAPIESEIACACGKLRARVKTTAGDPGTFLRCYCDDCQRFPTTLGRAEQFLDERGGTEIWQFSPGHLHFTQGIDNLACMRFSPKGARRWYARCCKTPLCNTIDNPQFAFVGLLAKSLEYANPGRSARDILGPPGRGVFGRFARPGDGPVDAADAIPASAMLGIMWTLLRRRLRGDHVRSPFWVDGRPLREAEIVGAQGR